MFQSLSESMRSLFERRDFKCSQRYLPIDVLFVSARAPVNSVFRCFYFFQFMVKVDDVPHLHFINAHFLLHNTVYSAIYIACYIARVYWFNFP